MPDLFGHFNPSECQHANKQTILTPETIHHAKEMCVDCGRFLRWLKKPETCERERAMAESIKRLWDKPLTDWEKQFLLSVEKMAFRISPKQQLIFDRIKRAYGE